MELPKENSKIRECVGGKVGEKMPLWSSEDMESGRNEKWKGWGIAGERKTKVRV